MFSNQQSSITVLSSILINDQFLRTNINPRRNPNKSKQKTSTSIITQRTTFFFWEAGDSKILSVTPLWQAITALGGNQKLATLQQRAAKVTFMVCARQPAIRPSNEQSAHVNNIFFRFGQIFRGSNHTKIHQLIWLWWPTMMYSEWVVIVKQLMLCSAPEDHWSIERRSSFAALPTAYVGALIGSTWFSH